MMKCLVVDDSRVIRKVARKILEEFRFQIEEAEDGASALEACRQNMPEAILLDSCMPGMSSVEFLRALRRENGGEKPVVVMCGCENDVALVTDAAAAGVDEYLLKPFDRRTLEATFAEAGLLR
ncbi:MAG: response regulator [Alphaproteobacteria bacterium]